MTRIHTDRHGNAVPFSPYTSESLEHWKEIIANDVMVMAAFGSSDTVRMNSVFGSGERLPIREAATIGMDLGDARCARTLGNERIYGPKPWEVAS